MLPESSENERKKRWPTPHLDQAIQACISLKHAVKSVNIDIDGYGLDVASVVAVARHGCFPVPEKPDIAEHLDASIQILHSYLANGHRLYGVNTGFGGNADTRTSDLQGLQRALMQLTQCGILTTEDRTTATGDYLTAHSMPTAWTRATIAIRCNAMLRGHSALTTKVLYAMLDLLRHRIIPVVPLRGSISASGDLMPLSYVAGAIQGSPEVFVRVEKPNGTSITTTADQALKNAGLSSIVLAPKEGLSLINGTAAAAGVATLGLYEANNLAVLSQLLTALTSEALYSNVEWAHSFIAVVRPHPGQIEAAQNIRTFLRGSKLVYGLDKGPMIAEGGLAQARYSTRSAPQWLAPYLEDLLSAEQQLTTELNSSSDNPLVDVNHGAMRHGGNFQAQSVTSATEKVRLALQAIGKMLFAQTSEMLNHDLSNGLPPNLAADEPSLSFCLKGVDISTAAYMSELAYLASPVSNHVQSAEMNNQAINSLGLLSARKTMEAVECLSLIAANCLYAGCQAVDLRTLHRTFLAAAKQPALEIVKTVLPDSAIASEVFPIFWRHFESSWYGSSNLDSKGRCETSAARLTVTIVDNNGITGPMEIGAIAEAQRKLADQMLKSYEDHLVRFFQSPITAQYLGDGTRALYLFVREKLQVPMHRGLVEHPASDDPEGNLIDGRPKRTIGSWISIVYEAIRDGSLAACWLPAPLQV